MHALPAVLLLLGILGAASSALADELPPTPTIEQLIAGVPVLTPETEGLEQFRIEYEIGVGNGVVIRTVYFWCRDKPGYLYHWLHPQAYPYIVVAGNQGGIVDLANRRVVTFADVAPYVVIGATKSRIQWGTGFKAPDKTSKLRVDLASLMKVDPQYQVLTQNADGRWQLQYPSPSGESRVTVLFERDPPYALHSLTAVSAIDGSPEMKLNYLQINDAVQGECPQFPPEDAFPPGLPAVSDSLLTSEEERDNDSEEVQQFERAMSRTLEIQAGVLEPKSRNPDLPFSDQQWKEMQALQEEFGPQLRALFGLQKTLEE